MHIYTDNKFLKKGIQSLQKPVTKSFQSNLIAMDVNNGKFALVDLNHINKTYKNPLHSYTNLCTGIISANKLFLHHRHQYDTRLLHENVLPMTEKESDFTITLLNGLSLRETAEQFQINVKTAYGLKARVEKKLVVRSIPQLAMRLIYWERQLHLVGQAHTLRTFDLQQEMQ